MKVLILTVSAGQGHNSTAAAVENVFTENGHECKKIDVGYQSNKLLGFIVDKGYLFSVDHLSGIYSKTYTKLLNREAGKNDMTAKLSRYISKKMRKAILDFDPDVIIGTHVICGTMLKPYIDKNEIHAKTFGILTDYTLHPFWEDATCLDYVIIPCKELADQCIKKGYREDQILPLGVPIQKKFSTILDKADAREKLGLVPDLPVVTVMSGSMCYGGVTNTVKALDALADEFQIIAVCGSSKKELDKLNSENFRHKVVKLGFTKEVNVVMDASDLVITKPGGLSTSEAMSRKIPMFLTKPIPGHEERNLAFFCENGVALAVTDTETPDKLFSRFLTDDALRNSMMEAAGKIGRFQAAEELYNFVTNQKD